MEEKSPKFKLEQDAGKFSEDPLEYDHFRRICGNMPEVFESMGFEPPLTPERHKRLSEISSALAKSLARYGLDAKPYDPDLLNWDPVFYFGRDADPWGALDTTERNKVHIRMFLPQLGGKRGYRMGRVEDDVVNYVFTHELIHVYSSRSWMIESQDGKSEERLARVGLSFRKENVNLWQWLNEGVTDDLAREEYAKIENYPPQKAYDILVQQFNKMVDALSRRLDIEPTEVKEVFRRAVIGKGKLLPLRSIIKPQFTSLLEFIKITDAPFKFRIKVESMEKVFNKLWQEIGAGQVHTKLQTELLQIEDAILILESDIIEIAEAIESDNDLEGARRRLGQILPRYIGAEIIIPGFEQLQKFSEADPSQPTEGSTKREIVKIMSLLIRNLPLVVFFQRYPEVKELFPVSESESDEERVELKIEKIYLKTLGIED